MSDNEGDDVPSAAPASSPTVGAESDVLVIILNINNSQ